MLTLVILLKKRLEQLEEILTSYPDYRKHDEAIMKCYFNLLTKTIEMQHDSNVYTTEKEVDVIVNETLDILKNLEIEKKY